MAVRIKNIVFDFGGVILNIHHQRVERAFGKLGVSDFKSLFGQAMQSHLFQDFEKGLLEPEVFRTRLRELTGLKVGDAVLDDTWNMILGDYPSHRINLLKEIAGNYRLFLLSNTNVIHYRFYQKQFHRQFGFDFNALFEKTYWSFRMGMRKPDPEPFLHILNHSRMNALDTLFIDDSFQNIDAATKLEIPSYWIKEAEDVSELFENGKLKDSLVFNKQ